MHRRVNWLIISGVITLIAATIPIFFDIYRAAAFNTVPRDDYAPYLLTLVGQRNEMPGAPFVYRILSVAVAIPFYYLVPTYSFTNLPGMDPAYLQATQALAISSYISLVLTAGIIYAISRKFGSTRAASLIAALLSFFLSNFISRLGIDPFAILTISWLVFWLDDARVFTPFILVSAGINEKIPILFAAILIFRWMLSLRRRSRFGSGVQLGFACLAVVGYFAAALLLGIPGNEGQTNPMLFFSSFRSSLMDSLSLKGLILNVLPVLVLSFIALLAVRSHRQPFFLPSDLSGMLVLFILALMADVVYNVGRIVMYAYPLYLPAAAGFIADLLKEDASHRPTSAGA